MIEEKIKKAFEKYGHFNSTHEVYAVLQEEVQEFFELVRLPNNKDQTEFKTKRMISELEDIATVVLRAIDELERRKIKWV